MLGLPWAGHLIGAPEPRRSTVGQCSGAHRVSRVYQAGLVRVVRGIEGHLAAPQAWWAAAASPTQAETHLHVDFVLRSRPWPALERLLVLRNRHVRSRINPVLARVELQDRGFAGEELVEDFFIDRYTNFRVMADVEVLALQLVAVPGEVAGDLDLADHLLELPDHSLFA